MPSNQSSQGPLRKISNPPISAVQISLKALSESLQLLWRVDARGDHIPELIALYRDGKFPFDRLVKTYPLSDINAAIHASETGEVIKPVVVFD